MRKLDKFFKLFLHVTQSEIKICFNPTTRTNSFASWTRGRNRIVVRYSECWLKPVWIAGKVEDDIHVFYGMHAEWHISLFRTQKYQSGWYRFWNRSIKTHWSITFTNAHLEIVISDTKISIRNSWNLIKQIYWNCEKFEKSGLLSQHSHLRKYAFSKRISNQNCLWLREHGRETNFISIATINAKFFHHQQPENLARNVNADKDSLTTVPYFEQLDHKTIIIRELQSKTFYVFCTGCIKSLRVIKLSSLSLICFSRFFLNLFIFCFDASKQFLFLLIIYSSKFRYHNVKSNFAQFIK
jgi:hypothetical protein